MQWYSLTPASKQTIMVSCQGISGIKAVLLKQFVSKVYITASVRYLFLLSPYFHTVSISSEWAITLTTLSLLRIVNYFLDSLVVRINCGEDTNLIGLSNEIRFISFTSLSNLVPYLVLCLTWYLTLFSLQTSALPCSLSNLVPCLVCPGSLLFILNLVPYSTLQVPYLLPNLVPYVPSLQPGALCTFTPIWCFTILLSLTWSFTFFHSLTCSFTFFLTLSIKFAGSLPLCYLTLLIWGSS